MIEHGPSYRAWAARSGTASPQELASQREACRSDEQHPLVSIITPVFNPPVDVLAEMIDSVRAQTYPYWELCIGDFGTLASIRSLLKQRAADDPRIKPIFEQPNRGISHNSNRCAALATGQLVALLDHDDVITPDALYESVSLIERGGHTLVYSDEDRLDMAGNRTHPFFKPDWSPSTLFSANYVTHLAVFRHRDLKTIGGWHAETDGAQDWDLFFRLAAIPGASVGHVPKMLYQWRALETSVAGSGFDAKPYAMAAQLRACQAELDRMGSAGVAQSSPSWHLEIGFPPADHTNAIVVWGGSDLQRAQTIRDLTLLERSCAVLDIAEFDAVRLERHATIAFWRAGIRPCDTRTIDDLAGWAGLGEFGVAGANVIDDRSGLIVGSGFVKRTPSFVERTFASVDPGFYGSEGGAGWYRNAVAVAPEAFAVRSPLARSYGKEFLESPSTVSALAFHARCSNAGHPSTFVATARATTSAVELRRAPTPSEWPERDPFANPALDSAGMVEWLSTGSGAGLRSSSTSRAVGGVRLRPSQLGVGMTRLDASPHAIDFNRRRNAEPIDAIRTAVLLIPSFRSLYAGAANILRIAASFVRTGIVTSFVVDGDETTAHELASAAYPELRDVSFETSGTRMLATIRADVVIATHWPTAYDALRMTRARHAAYFIQDDESMFYAAGSNAALAAETYRLGHIPFTNTAALRNIGASPDVPSFVVSTPVSLRRFSPGSRDQPRGKESASRPLRVLFYGRPDNPRNAFELGIAALTVLKRAHGSGVEILSAGDAWDEANWGVERVVRNLGKVAFDDLPALYRSCDVGLFLMFSRHPGVIPMEWMASGLPFVINEFQASLPESVYKTGTNCLTASAVPSALADAMHELLTNTELRDSLINGGRISATKLDDDWEQMASGLLQHLQNGKGLRS